MLFDFLLMHSWEIEFEIRGEETDDNHQNQPEYHSGYAAQGGEQQAAEQSSRN